MKKINYLALLRGINIGGKNLVKMDFLKNIFEEMGFEDVQTYIQSGNVLFKDGEKNKIKLAKMIENKLFEKLDVQINVLILTLNELENILNNKPATFGDENEKYKYDIVFLIEPLTTKEVLSNIDTKRGEDTISEGKNIFYITRLTEKLSGSYLTKIIKTPMWQNITIRNLKTTKKLYELLLDRE
ncbi:MAG: DUF1697 domain-containing protein [Spirochaetaceae bacterium]|jgi:uncharacterized protein (DUF1697 family)|nr:DUF1697 domain-containing protein [Spirochaetaceae bacterium]